jgi:hypothetical protein
MIHATPRAFCGALLLLATCRLAAGDVSGPALRSATRCVGEESLPLLIVVRVRSRPIQCAPLLRSLLWTLTPPPPSLHPRPPSPSPLSAPLHRPALCPAGKYGPHDGRAPCRECAKGRFTDEAGTNKCAKVPVPPVPAFALRRYASVWEEGGCECVCVCDSVFGQSRGARER